MFRSMRRSKQQLATEAVVDILQRNTSGTLALLGDGGYPYALPISYVYSDGRIYFHSAVSGHKIDAIGNQPKASFCVIDQDQVVPEKYTTYYRSVIAFGKIAILEDPDKAHAAATALAMKYAPDFATGIPGEIEASKRRMVILVMTIEHITGKEAIELVKR